MEAPGRYKMGTVVRLTGFSPALLRAWERRHKILDPDRGPGGHRLYTDDDLLILRYVHNLIEQGRTIGEIASSGRSVLLSLARQNQSSAAATLPQSYHVGAATDTLSAAETGGALKRFRGAIVEAALAMNSDAIVQQLDGAFSSVSADKVIHDVIEPGALEIGKLWAEGVCSVASEHLASGIFVYRLKKLVELAAAQGPETPLAVFSCFPDENHELGLLILAYYFARQGWRISYLGPSLPFEDLESACNILVPQVALLSVTRRPLYHTHKPRLIEMLKRRKDEIRFFVGGQGAPETDPEIVEAGGCFCPNTRPAAARVDEMVSADRNL